METQIEKRKYDVKIHWKSQRHEWSTRRKTVLAESMEDAFEKVKQEEEKPWRWEYHGAVKQSGEYRADW